MQEYQAKKNPALWAQIEAGVKLGLTVADMLQRVAKLQLIGGRLIDVDRGILGVLQQDKAAQNQAAPVAAAEDN